MGLLPMQVSNQAFVARIYPHEKTKNRCPGLQQGWDTFPALPEWSLTPAQQSSELLRSRFLGNSDTGLFSPNHNITGTKIIWWEIQMLKFVNKDQTRWAMRTPFVHDYGNRWSYSQLLRDLQSNRGNLDADIIDFIFKIQGWDLNFHWLNH